MLGVIFDVLFNESAYVKVAVVVAVPHFQNGRNVRLFAGLDKVFRQQLLLVIEVIA